MAHKMYESIKYENIVLGELLAITISPAEQHGGLHKGNPTSYEPATKDRPKAINKMLKKYLFHLTGADYRLYMEYSPLGIIHYHGYIRIVNKEMWASKDIMLLKEIGHFHVKKIDDMKKWDDYCKKQNTGIELNSIIEVDESRRILNSKTLPEYSGDRESEENEAEENEE